MDGGIDMKHNVIALMMCNQEVEIYGKMENLILPDGCIGVCYVFESKKAAREYWNKDVGLLRIEDPLDPDPSHRAFPW